MCYSYKNGINSHTTICPQTYVGTVHLLMGSTTVYIFKQPSKLGQDFKY